MARLNKYEFDNLMHEQSFDTIDDDTNCEICGLTFIFIKGIRQSAQYCGKEICTECQKEMEQP